MGTAALRAERSRGQASRPPAPRGLLTLSGGEGAQRAAELGGQGARPQPAEGGGERGMRVGPRRLSEARAVVSPLAGALEHLPGRSAAGRPGKGVYCGPARRPFLLRLRHRSSHRRDSLSRDSPRQRRFLQSAAAGSPGPPLPSPPHPRPLGSERAPQTASPGRLSARGSGPALPDGLAAAGPCCPSLPPPNHVAAQLGVRGAQR